MQDLKTWTCGHCERTILVPPQGNDDYLATILRIREHRFAHLTEALMHGSDEDLWRLCEDDSEHSEPFVPSCWADELMDTVVRAVGDEPVDSDDVTPVLEGIAELLRADLPRARRLWYPVNEDGGFNR